MLESRSKTPEVLSDCTNCTPEEFEQFIKCEGKDTRNRSCLVQHPQHVSVVIHPVYNWHKWNYVGYITYSVHTCGFQGTQVPSLAWRVPLSSKPFLKLCEHFIYFFKFCVCGCVYRFTCVMVNLWSQDNFWDSVLVIHFVLRQAMASFCH